MNQLKFVYLETYGCTANQNNSEIMKGLILQSGLQITSNPEIADLLVLNTCVVKEPTEKKIETRIKNLSKLYTKKPIIIAGCMPEIRKKFIEKNIYLLGIHHIKDICKLIKKIYEKKYSKEEFLTEKFEEKLLTGKIPNKKEIGITQISEGCLGNCSFCIVKKAKGSLFSYSEDKIIKNIQNDLARGAKEIWITSQDNSSYGLDNNKRSLPELLSKILSLKGNFQVRLGMMNPENILLILDELIEIYKHKKMKKFLHLPLQSGSNSVLKLMNRNYKAEDFLKIINKFKQEIPELFLSTDIIVGFPQETEQDFEKSLELIKNIKPSQLNLSRFWALKNTEAAKLPQLPVEIIKSRAKKFMEAYKKIRS